MYKPNLYIGSLILEDRKLKKEIRRRKILLATTIITVIGGILWLLIN